MRTDHIFVFSFAACLAIGVPARDALAEVPPTSCGLPANTERSGAFILSCEDPGFAPSDVWIDRELDYMYVSRASDAGDPHDTRVRVYDISDPTDPVHVTYLDNTFGSEALVGASVGGGNGLVFAANYCEGGCSGSVRVRGWNSCDGWDDLDLFDPPDPDGWDVEVAERGMHTLFYEADGGYLYAANNGLGDDAFAVPVWSVGTSCPFDDIFGLTAIPVTGLSAGTSQIHEVGAAHDQLAVAAWTDMVAFDVAGGPTEDSDEIGRVEGGTANANGSCSHDVCNVHSAYPLGPNKFWVTEERLGGRFMGFMLSGGVMIPKGSAAIPAAKGASYHEVAHTDQNAHLSAFQAGLRTWRHEPDEGSYMLGAYYDTSVDNCSTPCNPGTSWPGASGISYGDESNSRRIVAVANASAGSNRRVFLLSVYTPESSSCTGPSCTEAQPLPGGNAPYPDLLIARSSDDSVTQVGKLVRYPGSSSGLGSAVSLSQTGLTAGHDFGYTAVTGDFNRDGLVDVAVGAPGQQVGTVSSGRVYVYKRTSSGFSLLQTLDQSGLGTNVAGERFGAALAAGDFDADGDDDLVVGAPVASEISGTAAGAVFLFRASTTGLSGWTTIANTTNVRAEDRFGHAIVKGDFNGDGVADFVVAAPGGRVSSSSAHSGVVHVYKGVVGALPTFHSRKGQAGLDTDEVGDLFGTRLAVGDWNNDNRDDLVVGAPGEQVGDVYSGKMYAFIGSFSSMLVTWTSKDQTGLDTNEEGDLFGRRLVAGDFNNDGFDDVAVAAVGEQVAAGVRSGKVYVLRGSTSNLLTQVALDQATLQTNDDIDGFGERLGAGDWNADGKIDLAVTAPGLPSGAASNPLYLFRGTTSGPVAWQTLTVP